MIKTLLPILFLCLALAGCHVPAQQLKPVVENEGETYCYAQPLGQDAERLRFTLETLTAVREDGAEFPLPLRFTDFSLSQLGRQRLLAARPLPPGRYTGFAVKAKNAFLRGEDGESALLVAEERGKTEFPFEVKKGRGLLLCFTFSFEKSVNGVHFTPVFYAAVPGRPLPTLTGYVTNFGANTITVFDKHSGQAVDVIQTGRGPAGIVLDPKQRRAYVVLAGEDAVDVIDVATGVVINRIRLSPGDAPRDLALTPDGTILICANTGSNTLSFMDPLGLVETTRVSLVNRPDSVMLDRTGKRAYIFNSFNNSITIVDIPTRAVVGTFPTEAAPVRGDFSKKGERFVLFHQWSPYILVLDTASVTPTRRIYDEIGIGWIKIDTATDKIYVGKRNAVTVEIYDPFSFLRTDYLISGGGVSFMTIDGEENNLLLLIPDKRRLQFINLVSRQVTNEIDLDDSPYWVTLMGER